MYQYDTIDRSIVRQRALQFRRQTERFLAGTLSEDEFRPLRLQNGLYVQRHAPMLRVAIPYGMLKAGQLRTLARIAREYDRGYGHFSTRQNIQFNWPALERVPDILDELADVDMHAIQTSGNCIRNTTVDHFAGVAPDEVLNPLVYAEIIRQWSTLHPEFAFLPRKFKIALSGSPEDRAAVMVHDIGLKALFDYDGKPGFTVVVGGGLGRTPIVGHVIREFLPAADLLTYLDAILRVYNLHGRRDNKYKARIKILVKELGVAEFQRQVEHEWSFLEGGPGTLPAAEIARVEARFTRPAYRALPQVSTVHERQLHEDTAFARWVARNVHPHRVSGYAAVTISLKKTGVPPGDITAAQMDGIADLAERYTFGELRVTHEQNLVFADVERESLHALWTRLGALGLATANRGLITNIIACPGGDFCSLANAVSIPVASAIQERFDDLDYLHDVGDLDLNISGCMNSCGHHHVGHIGILGVDKNGQEWYQVSIGGSQGPTASLGKVIGPSFARADVPDVIERLIEVYLRERDSDAERFIDTVQRLGIEAFKRNVYALADQ
ncbi:MAG: nitrite/sulfite reductase [Betaproteobacteria bacterium]|jgi:sulfite reductase (NADPH) hemoprotein beta-component|nr:nitrite/sulfite reductase [Betaproteobacteria bacterium]